jgi:ATP-dependent Clp protease ATP-binding subunit ClpB
MQNLAQLKRQSNPLVVRGASAKTSEPGAPFAPLPDSTGWRLAVLDPSKPCSQAKYLESALRRVITGHDEVLRQIVRTYQVYLAGLSRVNRPIGNFLFVGPPGSGKTRAVEAVAEALLGNPGAVTRIDCAEFQHSYEITKLVGSPSGHPGNHEAALTEKLLNPSPTNSVKLTVLLFENVEKASNAFRNRLLGILENATLTLGNNRKVDFSKTLIFMTSTVVEVNALVSRKRGSYGAERNSQMSCSRAKPALRKFTSEFLDHLDRVVVFKASGNEELSRILQMELRTVQQRIQTSSARGPFVIDVSNSARQFLLAEGTDFSGGAKSLKRTIEHLLVQPLSNLISTDQIHTYDRIRITHIGASPSLTFLREVDAPEEWAADGAVA